MQDSRVYYFGNDPLPVASAHLVHCGSGNVSNNKPPNSNDDEGRGQNFIQGDPYLTISSSEHVNVPRGRTNFNEVTPQPDKSYKYNELHIPTSNDETDSKTPTLHRTVSRKNFRKLRNIQCFKCHFCDKAFKHKSYYDYHLRTHTGERPFNCHICPKSFFQRSKLNRHLNFCHNIKIGIYEDDEDLCGDNEKRKQFQCPTCNKSFIRSTGLQAHLLTHEGIRPFSCTKCDRNFSGLTALKNHEKIAHQDGSKGILCDLCGKAFLLRKYLNLHTSTTHKKDHRPHKCSKCRKEFHTSKDLTRHLLVHSSERNFTCSICQTSFKRRDNLNRHLKLTHLLTNEQICDNTGSANVGGDEEYTLPELHPPLLNQVSVIKSTQEVMMSMSIGRGQI